MCATWMRCAVLCVAAVLALAACEDDKGQFSLGGTISGLTASGLVLSSGTGQTVTVASSATSFTFAVLIEEDTAYSVTVSADPTGQTCVVSSGSGTITANVTNVAVTCVSSTALVLIAAAPNGDLFTVNETTGATTLLLNTSTDGTTDIGVVSSMLYFPATPVLWLGTGRRFTNACRGCVMTVNPATGVATLLADNFLANGAMPGLAMNSGGNVFSVRGDDDVLVSVDSVTGLTTQIGPNSGFGSSYGGNGMTFNNADTLFIGSGQELYSVDTATGVGTLIGGITFTGFAFVPNTSRQIVAMATRVSDDTVFGLLKFSSGSSVENSYLVTVNTATAELTNVGQMDARYDGLVFAPASFFPVP